MREPHTATKGASMLPCRAMPRTREKQRASGPRHQRRPGERNGLRPGSGCHGGLMVLPCGAMQGNRNNCSYSTTTLFLHLLEHTHLCIASCAGFGHTHVATLPCACTHLPFSSQVQRRSVCSCLRRLCVKVGLSQTLRLVLRRDVVSHLPLTDLLISDDKTGTTGRIVQATRCN